MKLKNMSKLRIEDLPIPRDAQPGKGWTDSMHELACHIGAYPTLLLVEKFGGLDLYIPMDAAKCPTIDLIGEELTAKLCATYGRESLSVPVAGEAIRRAKRAGIISAVRAHSMSLSEAAHILRSSRRYVSRLVNQSDEGALSAPYVQKRLPDPRQLVMFDTLEQLLSPDAASEFV